MEWISVISAAFILGSTHASFYNFPFMKPALDQCLREVADTVLRLDLKEKANVLFAFGIDLDGGELDDAPIHFVDSKTTLQGDTVKLIRAVCDCNDLCCEVKVTPTSRCWNPGLFPGKSPGLNIRAFDVCADEEIIDQKQLSYAFSSLAYWSKPFQDRRMMFRKDSPNLAKWWDFNLKKFICSRDYDIFCKKTVSDSSLCLSRSRRRSLCGYYGKKFPSCKGKGRPNKWSG